MKIEEILNKVDHTELSVTAKWEDIKELCDDAIKYSTASVCIPSSYVSRAYNYVNGRIPICTVIGFPNGYSTTATKVFEAKDAIASGASEIDMVINIGKVKDGLFDEVLEEIKQVKAVCGDKVLKVIIETCLLTYDEKVQMCKIISEAGADFIKTSTGFTGSGATIEDIEIFKKHLDGKVKIKASGGIKTLEDAENFINHGADRLGASSIVKTVKDMNI